MDVFTELGQFPELYNLELVDNFQSKIVYYRTVPIAVKDRYELKLKLLIDQEVVDYVNRPTDWTNHVVVIEKLKKTLRICLDPQHLNKNIKDEQFPIPTLNEIVPKLKNKVFYGS